MQGQARISFETLKVTRMIGQKSVGAPTTTAAAPRRRCARRVRAAAATTKRPERTSALRNQRSAQGVAATSTIARTGAQRRHATPHRAGARRHATDRDAQRFLVSEQQSQASHTSFHQCVCSRISCVCSRAHRFGFTLLLFSHAALHHPPSSADNIERFHMNGPVGRDVVTTLQETKSRCESALTQAQSQLARTSSAVLAATSTSLSTATTSFSTKIARPVAAAATTTMTKST
jgi:hypothetical protein